jgi:hypothetical protein
MKKKVIDVLRKYSALTYQLNGTVDEVIQHLQELKESVVEGSELILEYELEYGSYGDADRHVINLYDRRLETDEEYADRTKKEAVASERALNNKRRQLEQLKKELGEK